jgi:hypothetical protein
MIPKSGYRFSDQIMLKKSMIPESGYRFSDQIMLKRRGLLCKVALLSDGRNARP